MTADIEEPENIPARKSEYQHDSGWELPELAPVLIIVSVGLLVIGSGISTGMSLVGQSGFQGGLGWSLVASALRWIDPSTSTLLLLAAALIWWQYGYWASNQSVGQTDEVVNVHIARLRTVAKWNLAAFLITIASVILLILASILQNTYSGATISIWADSVGTICMALGTILLSLLGVVALQRIVAASRLVDPDDDWESV
jgi:Zn-dependent protease